MMMERLCDRCDLPARFRIARPAGPGRTRERFACGRHLTALVDYMTVVGRSVEVTRPDCALHTAYADPNPAGPHVCDVAECERSFATMDEVIAHERGHRE